MEVGALYCQYDVDVRETCSYYYYMDKYSLQCLTYKVVKVL